MSGVGSILITNYITIASFLTLNKFNKYIDKSKWHKHSFHDPPLNQTAVHDVIKVDLQTNLYHTDFT